MTVILNRNIEIKKNSGIELLRIVAMILIIAHHYAVHGGFSFSSASFNSVFVAVLALGGKIGVNLFVLITGYYSQNLNFSFEKILRLVLQVEFFSLIMSTVSVICGAQELSKKFILKMFFPFFFGGGYWFICIYLLLYICIPFINKALKKTTKRELGFIILTLVFLWTLMPFTVGKIYSFNNYGYSSLGWFVLLYLIGAYFRKYSFFLYNKRLLLFVLIIFFSIGFISFCVLSNIIDFPESNIFLEMLRTVVESFADRSQNAIFPLILSILIFIFFRNLISNRTICFSQYRHALLEFICFTTVRCLVCSCGITYLKQRPLPNQNTWYFMH